MKTAKAEFFLRAGDSVFFSTKYPGGKKHPRDYDDSLEELGYQEFSRCPADRFKPDLHKLPVDVMTQMHSLLNGLDASQVRIMTYIMAQQDKLSAIGYTFAQRVYVNLSSPRTDYLDNWFKAYMLCHEDEIDGVNYLYVTGSLNDVHSSLLLLPESSIMSEEDFLPYQAELLAEGKIKNPKPTKFKRPKSDSKSLDLSVPSIDTVKDKLLPTTEKQTLPDRKKKSSKKKKAAIFVVTD